MKLRIIGFEQDIEFEENQINILKIENANLLCNILENINDNVNGISTNEVILLDEKEEITKMEDKIYILLDIFNIEYNSKKILNKIYKQISEKIKLNEDYELETLSLKIRKYLTTEINEMPFEFIMKNELDIEDILKLFNLKIDETTYQTLLERLEFFINVLSTLKIAEILIIPNIKLYLNEKEIIELYKYSLYNNIKLLIIERNLNQTKLKYEKIYYIDSEFDEIIE